MLSEKSSLPEFEQQLAGIVLPSARVNRDALMFEAGRQAARAEAKRSAWPLATVASMAASVALAVLLVREWNQPAQVATNEASRSTSEPEVSAPGVSKVVEVAVTQDEETPVAAFAETGPNGSPPRATTAKSWLAWWPGNVSNPRERLATTSLIGRRLQLTEDRSFVSSSETTSSPPTPQTARELLDELLGS